MRRTLTLSIAAAALAVSALAGPVAAARPDIECQQAGIAFLQDNELLSTVARDGLPISTAVSVGVGVRHGASLAGVPDPLPLSVILADHRAGDGSLFLYPWC